MNIKQFLGINNVADPMRLAEGELTAAWNVDISSRGGVRSRRGRTLLRAGTVHSLYESPFGLFAVVDGNLLLMNADGTTKRTVYASIGAARVWYALLQDGRVGFSNGLVQGLASAAATTDWGVPTPGHRGLGTAGATLCRISYVRLSDGLEGPLSAGEMVDRLQPINGLPTLAGYSINVYLAPYGDQMLLAGNTTGGSINAPSLLGAAYVGSTLSAPPPGTQLTVWNSRVLFVDGRTLWASRPFQPEMCDAVQDFLQFPDTITLLYGTDAGLFVGTSSNVYFLTGAALSELKFERVIAGAAVLGSCVEIPTSYLPEGMRPKAPRAALCLINGEIHVLSGAGQITSLTADRYRTSATEVHATVRLRDGVMQYLVAPA